MHRVYASLTWQSSKLASWGYILHLHTRAILWLQVTSGKKTNLVKLDACGLTVTVVCVSVTMLAASYLFVYTLKTRCC